MVRRSSTGALWESNPDMHSHTLTDTQSILSSHTTAMFVHEAHCLSHPLKPVQSIRPMTPLSPCFPSLQLLFYPIPPTQHSYTRPSDGRSRKRPQKVMPPSKANQMENLAEGLVTVYSRSEGLATHRPPHHHGNNTVWIHRLLF